MGQKDKWYAIAQKSAIFMIHKSEYKATTIKLIGQFYFHAYVNTRET